MAAYINMADSPRKIALTAGIFYLLTFVSIPTLSLYTGIHDPNYILGPGPDTNVFIGVILELIVALTGIGTAVALYPLLKKQNGSVALGLVGARVLEAATIFVGAAFLLAVVTLRQSGIGAEGLVTALDDLLLGYLLYKSKLVPRTLSIIGLIGVPTLVVGNIFVLFGILGQRDPSTFLFAVPVAVFEFTLGIWLIVKGFNSSAPLISNAKTNG